jgi:ankyrin repeat protein
VTSANPEINVLKIVEFLVGQNPQSLSARNQGGELPLHIACATFRYVGIVRFLVEQAPESILVPRTTDGAYPLHVALERGASLDFDDTDDVLEIIAFLVDQNPGSLSARNQGGELPLHVACTTLISVEIVQFLVEQAPESILVPRTTDGAYPLHVVLEQGSPLDSDVLVVTYTPTTDDVLEIIEFLVGENPGSLSARNQGGELPLHVACAMPTSVEIVRFLVEQAPESILVPRTTDGAYPLHIALEKRGASSQFEVIKILLERHDPVTILLRNNAGKTPLHVACGRGASFVIAESLVHRCKASVQLVTPQGDLPLFLACATAVPSLSIIYLLLKLYPDVVYP